MTGARPSTNTQALRAATSLRDSALAFFSWIFCVTCQITKR
jgi:hypothetical protein